MERKATLLCALLAAVLLSIGISAQGNVTSSLNTTMAATSDQLHGQQQSNGLWCHPSTDGCADRRRRPIHIQFPCVQRFGGFGDQRSDALCFHCNLSIAFPAIGSMGIRNIHRQCGGQWIAHIPGTPVTNSIVYAVESPRLHLQPLRLLPPHQLPLHCRFDNAC